ncbi:hypothetical protein J3R83DRAFT_11626 [Lanmaoa asiatica]|nr:hypothetical protein J3R83DRAFT_5898 [Lanmaoa asiatica]KAH0834270.1 hypothetical protein J3R83DRAFT_11626 [Lanmaoa asiatica]
MSSPYTSTINDLIAGSFGGAAQVLVGQPLDTIKTRAQTAPSASTSLSPLRYFTPFMVVLILVIQKECL